MVTWPPTQDEWAEYYKKGVDIHVEAAGGSDLVAFSADALSPEPFDITSPHTDTDGKIQSISTDQPLEILWSGGSNFDNLVLILEAYYCPGSIAAINFMVMCHVENDGDFTIPAEHLSDLEWPNYVTLHMTMSQKVSLEVPEIEPDTAWSIRSISTVPIYENPDASPPPYNCESDFMEEGFVGNACLDDSECGSGCCLPEILDMYFYDNYCSITGCTSDNQCPTDAVCAESFYISVPWQTYCAKKCSSDSDCRFPELACLPTSDGTTACIPNFW